MDTFEKVRGFLHNKPINESNIIVFKNVYALGDLLLIPKICGNYTEYHEHPYYRANINAYNNSILAIYEELRTDKIEYIPNLNKIQQSVEIYIQRSRSNEKMNDLIEFVKRDDVLCVHLRSGDYGDVEEEYKEIIKKLQKEYQYVIIMCGAHHHHKHDVIIKSVNSLFNENNNIGFGQSLEKTGSEDKAMKEFFKPELRNRIDCVCKFDKLDTLAIKKVVLKFVDELKDSLMNKNIRLNLTEAVIDMLADKGYDNKMGA
jgi:hypothetical protein